MSCCYHGKPFHVPLAFNWDPYYSHHGFYHGGHCPVCSMPHHQCSCNARPPMRVYREMAVDTITTSKEEFTGGLSDVRLTLEYMPVSGAVSPSVKVTLTGSGGTSTWDVASIPDGYHIKDDFTSVEPGTKVKIEATECIARLRWFETILS